MTIAAIKTRIATAHLGIAKREPDLRTGSRRRHPPPYSPPSIGAIALADISPPSESWTDQAKPIADGSDLEPNGTDSHPPRSTRAEVRGCGRWSHGARSRSRHF